MPDCSSSVASGSPPPPECLAAAAYAVAHDLELLDIAWAEKNTRLGWSLWFVLARSLMDFFFKTDREKDTILASDFPAVEPWPPFAASLVATAEKLPAYKAVRAAANKNVAHLTYERTNENAESRIPPSEPVHRFLKGVASEWMSRLNPEARVWFGS